MTTYLQEEKKDTAMRSGLKLIECPRDAMQGWKTPIPTPQKVEYLNALLQVGFHTLDFGSFVSPKTIPQMADTAEVLKGLELNGSTTRLLAIIANERGARTAVEFDEITYLGFPFSISETFQLRNTNSTPLQSLKKVEEIQELCVKNGKELVVYLSMGFGNPYGDEYTEDMVPEWISKLQTAGVQIFSLADTVGIAKPELIRRLSRMVTQIFPDIETGVHLHARVDGWKEKLSAAYESGIKRFDGALKGIGGCPMANDDLVGNMRMEYMIGFFEEKGFSTGINKEKLQQAMQIANRIFGINSSAI